MTRFQNRTAVVTGGTTGIGFAAAQRLIAEGARVLITGQDSTRVVEAAKKLDAEGVVVDQSSTASLVALADMVRERLGRIDVLVLNAGVAPLGDSLATDEATYDRVFAVNTKAPFFIVQALAPLLAEGGAVVAVTSVVDQVASAGMVAYGATKAALRALVRSWAAELLPRGIRVNGVAPGPIATPIFGKLGLDEATQHEVGKQIIAKVPMGRFGTPDEVAGAIAFLASADASYITGTDLLVAGGWGDL